MTLTADTPVSPAPAAPSERPNRWTRPALLALLAGTALLYLWGLGSSGWANDFYAAAAQAGTQNWKAWLFGSLDAGNAITVDKPPAAIWVMALSGRLFGFTPFTMLLPQALMGVASVGVLYAAVRRVSGPGAGLLAGLALAVMPVAASMFRYNNPDALLVLLLVVAAYLMVRAIETGATRWVVGVGVVLGVAFLTKMLQAFLVVPGLALAFLVAAPVAFWPRVGKLVAGGAAMVATAGPFLALVSLWPADSRPYIGGSTDNSLLQLALGYNGIQRVMGRESMPGAGDRFGGGGGLFFGGQPGIGRMFGPSFGAEASWLLPAALIGLVAGLWFTRRTARTATVRASLLLWGGWLLVTAAVFSFMDGTIHPYYTLALAPAVAALVGICVTELWRGRQFWASRAVLAALSAVTGVWSFILLDRAPDWQPWLRWVVLIGSVMVAAVLAAGAHRLGRFTVAVAAAAILLGGAGSLGYAIETAAHAPSGPGAMAGPAAAHADFGFGGPGGPGGPDGPGGFGKPVSDNAALQNLVRATDNRWAAASVGSMTAGRLELDTGTSVMAIGGFTGSDDSPTLAQFQAYVADGQVRYFIAGGHHGPGRDSGTAAEITAWVQKNFTPMDVGGTTVYDLAR
ncbi:glycosyltransferase family 39 protein [Mycolicibacterium rufum]|uniref:Glycosyltransferase family 39 protein n=1 Tax=Mycolicibacterium rufum TaxID=318424 RepID=A0A9X2YBV1_9MYCO|nr:glycosyltransferase family 39 protein [Mycolicibacterium rufum]KGI69315.1 glycosyl transferase [Mycolicibacterium rufum]MCV7069861.1 glycosyltransferase family 39 protein [Mycolicibacterium rufum]ULP35506.1 glycosyltransferase family 39 protein [Mycolicibacterium rufum]